MNTTDPSKDIAGMVLSAQLELLPDIFLPEPGSAEARHYTARISPMMPNIIDFWPPQANTDTESPVLRFIFQLPLNTSRRTAILELEQGIGDNYHCSTRLCAQIIWCRGAAEADAAADFGKIILAKAVLYFGCSGVFDFPSADFVRAVRFPTTPAACGYCNGGQELLWPEELMTMQPTIVYDELLHKEKDFRHGPDADAAFRDKEQVTPSDVAA